MTGLLLAWALGVASAQDRPWWTRCNEYTELDALPSTSLRDQALEDNAQLYGVVQTTEADLFPLLDSGEPDDTRVAFEIGMRTLWGAEQLPSLSVQGEGCGPAHAPLDVFTSSFGVGARTGPVGWFYATNVQGRMTSMNPLVRGFGSWMGSSLGLLYAPVAPFVGSGGNDQLRWSWMLGAQVRPGTMTARVGWMGRDGLYTNVDERWTSLFLRSTLRPFLVEAAESDHPTVSRLPYLASGVDRLPLPDDLREAFGSTRLFGRRITWYTQLPPPVDEQTTGGDPREAVDLHLTSGHVEQYDIVGLFDVRGSWTVQPVSQLHELVAAVHTPYYSSPELGSGDPGLALRLQVGATQVPAAWYYGVSPGMKPTFAVDAGWGNPKTGQFGRLRLRHNHADVLDLFPYAVGAVSMHLEVGFLAL